MTATKKDRSIGMAVLRIYLPVLLGLVFENIYMVINGMVVGRFTDKVIFAAVGGVTSELMFFLQYLLDGIAYGTSGMVANKYGEGKRKEIVQVIHGGLLSNLGMAVLSIVLLQVFTGKLLGLLGVPEEVAVYASYYIRCISFSLIPMSFWALSREVMRSLGNAKTPLICGVFSSIISGLLALLFVAVLHLGLNGVILSTLIGQTVGAGTTFYYMRKLVQDIAEIDLLNSIFKAPLKTVRNILIVGLSISLDYEAYTVSGMIVNARVNSYGVDTIAAFSILTRIEDFFFIFITAYGIAIFMVIAQQYGAGERQKARETIKQTIKPLLVVTVLVSLLLFMFANSIAQIFTDDTNVEVLGANMIKFIAPLLPLYLLVEIPTSYVQACDRAFHAMLIAITGIGLARCLFIGIVTYLNLGVLYCILSYCISWAITGALFWIYLHFNENKWWNGKQPSVEIES